MTEIIIFAVAVVLHECGHIAAAGIFGVRLVSLRSRGIGAVMSYDFSTCSYLREAAVHLSGPLLNLLSALTAVIMYGSRAYYFCGISLTLALVNLLPIKGFDGGGVARCILSRLFMPDTAWRICGVLSAVGIIIMWTAVLWVELRCGGNLALMIFVLVIMTGQLK
ncbi:MAG: hypothetical protein E7628_03145 [Ruminococcaceae bacterium]|nr:hypothetical protein [Oscillospiraceae bacterium]